MWEKCDYLEERNKENINKREKSVKSPSVYCIIKGNISEKGYGKTYLVPGCYNYKTVKIDLSKCENYFCTEAEAMKAGFRKATNCS